ncbi:MAG: translocation/assembly module TamB [Treponema sp.]|nr:translocation/assembly module TamB [Treponema sp.]
MLVFTKPGQDRAADNKTPPEVYIFPKILVFAVLFILTLLVLRPIQKGIHARMEEVRDGLIRGAEAYLGRKITYSSIGPSIFGTLDIRNIRIFEEESGLAGRLSGTRQANAAPEPLLFISRFRISWSLMDLIRGRPHAIHSVQIDRPALNLDLERDRDFMALVQNLLNSGDLLPGGFQENLAALFPGKVLFRIRHGRGNLGAGISQYQFRGLNLDISVADQQIALQGKGNAGVSLAGFLEEPFTAQAALEIAGSCSAALDEGRVLVTIPFISGDLFRFRSLGFDVTLEDNTVVVKKALGGDFDFSLNYGISSGDLLTFFEAREFSPRDFLSLQGSWKQYSPWLALALTGDAFLERDSRGNINYRVGLSGLIPANVPLGGSALTLDLEGDQEYVAVKQIYFGVSQSGDAGAIKNQSLRGELNLQGGVGLKPLAPNGRISFSDFSLTGEAGLTTDITVSTQGREINLFGETLDLGTVRLSLFDALVIPSAGDLHFSLSALRFAGMETYGEVRRSSLSLNGSFDYEPRQVELSFNLDSFSVGDLNEMTASFVKTPVLSPALRNIQDNLAITTEIFFTTDFEHVLYNAPLFVIAHKGIPDISGLVSISGTDQRFDLTEGQITWARGGLLLNGYMDFSNPRELTFSLMTNYRDLSYFFEGLVLDSRSLSIDGSYGLRAYINPSPNGGYSGRIEAADIPVPFRGQYARLNLESILRYESPRSWSFDVDRLELLDILTPGSPGAAFRLSGGLDQDGALFPSIVFDDGKGELNGKALIAWDQDFTGTLIMEKDSGDERYNLEASYQDEQFELRLSAFRAQLGRFLSNSYNALADGDIRVSWNSVESFQADIQLVSLNGRIQDAEFLASAQARLDPEEFSLQDLRLSLAGLNVSIPWFRVNRAASRMETEAVIQGAAAGRTLDLVFAMNAGFDSSQSWLEFSRALDSFRGGIYVSEARLDALRSGEPFEFLFSREGPVLSLSGGPRQMIRLQIDGNGDFYAGLSSPSPIRGSITGNLSPKTINAQTPDLYIDLKSLWNFIPSNTDIVFTGGYVNAALEIRGPLGDPEFFGRARGNSLRIQVPGYISKDIFPIPFDVAIEGNEMIFGPVPATVGGGAGSIMGWFRFDRWIPNIFNMDIHVPHETPIPFDFDITGFLAQGLVSGDMTLSMEDMVFGITGNLTANETEISLDTDEINQAQGIDMFADLQKPVNVNINVLTGRKVEFLWPNSEFPILQASADMGTLVKVTTDTLARRFSLTSDVKIRSGELFYFERSFYIKEGSLTFRENEIQFDPRISVRAEVRDRTNEGPVTISMIVENAPLLSFTARFESSPPLSQMEIFALLGQNLTGAPVDESSGAIKQAFANSLTDALAQFGVVRRLERQVREFLRLDMLSFRTQVLQNAVFQATGLQSPVDRINGVGNYFDNTTVFLGKYFGPDVFAQAMLSLRYDKNKTTMGGLTFETDIGMELEGPFFNIRWDFIPTHPENWFVNDTSITLTWTRSF